MEPGAEQMARVPTSPPHLRVAGSLGTAPQITHSVQTKSKALCGPWPLIILVWGLSKGVADSEAEARNREKEEAC